MQCTHVIDREQDEISYQWCIKDSTVVKHFIAFQGVQTTHDGSHILRVIVWRLVYSGEAKVLCGLTQVSHFLQDVENEIVSL